MDMPIQKGLFTETATAPAVKTRAATKKARSGTFTDNMKLPIHRWFRYSAGFSAEWVESVVSSFPKKDITVFDPFAGSGTTLVAAAAAGAKAEGYESHPFVARIAKAKLLWDKADPESLIKAAADLSAKASKANPSRIEAGPLLSKCYTPDSLAHLYALREAMENKPPEDGVVFELLRLALTAILRPCSHAGTAQWQYVLPNKSKAKVLDPFDAFSAKVGDMAEDIAFARKNSWRPGGEVFAHDARKPSPLKPGCVDLVITSPPYPNNYDYADATRLEMSFWGEIEGWSDLQDTVRTHIVRSCSQHTAAERLKLDDLLALSEVSVIRDELAAVCRELEIVRLTKGGRKTYHTMIAAYYADLSRVFVNLRPICSKGSKLCFVIGDSAPYGVHAPADKWLGRLAEAAGFHGVSFEKLRDRNTKWKNRKHTVPLHEGRLWFDG